MSYCLKALYQVYLKSIFTTTSRLVVAKEGGDKGGMDWEFEISRYKLLHIAWINKDLL